MTDHERAMSALEEMRGRADAATPGPWEASGVPYDGVDDPAIFGPQDQWIAGTVYDMQSLSQNHEVDADTVFIASVRTDATKLIAALKAALTALESVQFGSANATESRLRACGKTTAYGLRAIAEALK